LSFLYPALGGLLILLIFAAFAVRQARDLLRVRAYRDFVWRLIPFLTTGVFIAALPFVMQEAIPGTNYMRVLIIYLAGAAVITVLMSLGVSPEERRAARAFRKGEYEKAASIYEQLIKDHPLPRYYSALGACLDAAGNHHAALEATDRAAKLDPKLGIAYYNRASAHAALGEKELAISDLRAVFRSDSDRRLRRAAERALRSLEGR
jgi:tetratricopeptide (TPR) repeat protein